MLSVEILNDVCSHFDSFSAALPLFINFNRVEAAVPHMFINLVEGALCQLFGDTQSHIHVLLVIAYLTSLHSDFCTIM